GGTDVASCLTCSAVDGRHARSTHSPYTTLFRSTYTIVATYNGSSNFNGSSDSSASLTVGARNTTTVANNASSTYSEQAVNVTLSGSEAPTSEPQNPATVACQLKHEKTNVGSAVTSSPVSGGNARVTYS